jgi:hypothetical protein
MLQIRYLGDVTHAGGESGLGALPGGGRSSAPSSVLHRFFGFGAWAFPLDDRSPTRLSLQLGYKFLVP